NAATTGLGQVSIAAITAGSCGSCKGAPNSLISEPAIKVLLAPISTAAFTVSSAATAATASSSPARTAREPAFTGGLSMMITAISPSRARRTGDGADTVLACCVVMVAAPVKKLSFTLHVARVAANFRLRSLQHWEVGFGNNA